MKATEVIEQLIRLGSLIKDAAEDAGARNIDWAKFFASPEYARIGAAVQALVARLDEDDVASAIARMKKKQLALLNGRSVGDLPAEQLFQYMDLSDARLALAARKVQIAANPPFLQWLVEDALPVLLRTGPKVVALLL